MIKIQKFLAKSISYSILKRNLNNVIYIAIHNTGNNNDTAWNNAKFFANGNDRKAGAHFFVDQAGNIVQSIDMNRTAYAVGGFVSSENGGASLYKKCTNANSVSIELCDIVNKDPSPAMIAATEDLIEYIQVACPNAKTIVRHWDASGKLCPARFVDKTKWLGLKKKIDPALQNPYGDELEPLKMVMADDAFLRTSPEVKQNKVAYSSLSASLKKKCNKSKEGYAVFKTGSAFSRIRSYKDKDNNKWLQLKSGYWIPAIYKGERRAKEAN